MNESPYQVRGVGIPTMLGRGQLFDRLCRHLTKPTPDHICVVGPPSFGKSVVLNHLASHFGSGGNHFVTSLYWNLRHGTPGTDEDFLRHLAVQIKNVLQSVRPDLADYLVLEEEGLQDFLDLVFAEMDREGIRFLAVLDGFDHVLAGSGITRNLWDGMRTLGQHASLRLVTGSRKRLRELCKTEDSRTSDFWEIFYDTPLEVGCLEEHDWDGFLGPFKSRGIMFDSSARKEITNWTGGVPVLAAAMADMLFTATSDGATISKPDVDRAGEAAAEERRDLLVDLWENCPFELQSDLAALADSDLSRSELPDDRRRDLELRGFALSSGNKLRASCRLIVRFATGQASEMGNMRRLFGDAESFEGNIRGLLELRLSQIREADADLIGFVRNAVRDLLPRPNNSLIWARSIAERALQLIWEAELPLDKSLPESWKHTGTTFGVLPSKLGPQCGLLRRITGTEEHAPISKFVTKPTCLFVDHIQSVGDLGQHKEGVTVSVPIAAAFCMSAIGLCESLVRDLPNPKSSEVQKGT